MTFTKQAKVLKGFSKIAKYSKDRYSRFFKIVKRKKYTSQMVRAINNDDLDQKTILQMVLRKMYKKRIIFLVDYLMR